MKKKYYICFLVLMSLLLFFACEQSNVVVSLNEKKLFSLDYGNFEDEINLFSLVNPSPVKTSIEMRDGFFYIANGESKKIMELNSYGDLITIFYNKEFNPVPSFALTDLEKNQGITTTTRKAIEYPLNSLGDIAVDSRKYVYVVDKLPIERQEQDVKNRLLLSQVILRFDSNGNYLDYIGQQGPGGLPFPYIKNIYTTEKNELVVVCQTNDGMTVYWFNDTGYLLYTIPFFIKDLPNPLKDQTELEMFLSLEKIIPSYTERKLFVKIDYYTTSIDSASNVLSGIDYTTSLLYPLNIETGLYDLPLTIPPFEDEVSDGFTKLIYPLSFDFLGVTQSGWLFFIISDDSGYTIQMIQEDGQKIIKRHLNINNSEVLYNDFTLSAEGILSVLLAYEDKANVLWWRTDSLIDAFLQN